MGALVFDPIMPQFKYNKDCLNIKGVIPYSLKLQILKFPNGYILGLILGLHPPTLDIN